LGVTGANCSTITVSGEPTNSNTAYTQNSQVGDIIDVDSEVLRIVVKTSSTSLVVQRGYIGSSAAHSSGATMTFDCGPRNQLGSATPIWDYADDPYGANAGWNTIVPDPYEGQAHEWNTPTISINGGAAWYYTGDATCPVSALGSSGACYI